MSTDTTSTDTTTDEKEIYAWVPVTEILPDPSNLRQELKEIPELAQSIEEVGLVEPPILRIDDDGHYRVVAGHRRVAAMKYLGRESVRCIVRKEKMRPAEIIATMIIENNQRTDLDPIEEAHGLMRLRQMWEVKDEKLGERIGRTQNWVSGRIALLSLSPEDQDRVRKGEMTLGAGIEKARATSGRVRPGAKGKKGPTHFSFHHPLANKVQRRCSSKRHKKSANWIGGIGCGNCWEEVIRANEREHIHEYSIQTGTCAICKSAMEPPKMDGEDEKGFISFSEDSEYVVESDLRELVKQGGPCEHCKMTMHDCAFKSSEICCSGCKHPRMVE